MPYDSLGNPLLLEDTVVVKVGDQTLIATITEIKEPSVLAPGPKEMQMPGTLALAIPYAIMYDSRNPRVANVYKVVKPPNFGKKAS